MEPTIQAFLETFSIPWVGLTSVAIMAFLAATFLPFSSEAVVLAYLMNSPEKFWLLIAVASFGNTLGGVLNWQIGFFAKRAKDSFVNNNASKAWISAYLHQFGPKSLLLAWVPIVGDPLVIAAGWAKLPFIPCCIYMAIGKTARYCVLVGLYMMSSS